MEAIFVLLGLAVLAIPFAVIGLLVSVSRLKHRVATLEEQVSVLRFAAPASTAAPTVPASPFAEAAIARAAERPSAAAPAPVRAEIARPEQPPEAIAASEVAPAEGSGLPPLPEVPLAPPQQPQGPDWITRLVAWTQANWVYLASAVSLGFAGIYLVQYGAEHGLLTPSMRILLALTLGAALIVAGEVIRRRFGDEDGASSAVLPSTLSAAGIVVLYAAILAARGLYGLIGSEVTFASLLAVSAMALVFGWFYGPFLAAAGLTGAAAAPFLVGGEGGNSTLLFAYFGLLATSGLAIDAIRRWGWVSFLALALGYGGGGLIWLFFWDTPGYTGLLIWLAAAATVLPRLQLRPTHPGPSILQGFVAKPADGSPRPIAPSWIATLAIGATSLLLLALGNNSFEFEFLFIAAAGLAAALFVAVRQAEGIADAPFLPSLAFLLLIPTTGPWGYFVADEATSLSNVPSLILGLGALISAAAFLRSLSGPWPRLHAAAAALVAPLAAVGIEVFWQPETILGAYPWALHVMALAAVMTFAALRYAAIDGGDKHRAAYAVLSALSLIALATFILLSDAALTVALAVLVAAAAWLDRRFRLPEMTSFISAGIIALGWRLVVDPGLLAYVEDAPLLEVLLAYGSALLGLGAARQLLPYRRGRTRAALESTVLAYGGVLLSILIWRLVLLVDPTAAEITHWSASLLGLIWMALALAQAVRARQGGPLARPRLALAAIEGIAAVGAFVMALTVLNPAFSLWERVLGPQPLDTLLVAYGLPGLLLAFAARRSPDPRFRTPLAWSAGGFLALWAALAIRRFWRGDVLAVPGFSQPELYTYTVALLLIGGALLYQAIASRSGALRRVAMGVIALAIAKVFLVDAAGLTGLLRVFSFLGLGLVLAGLAWLNRWAAGHQEPGEPPAGSPPAPLTGS
jgi:uncharacterized membrane protein